RAGPGAPPGAAGPAGGGGGAPRPVGPPGDRLHGGAGGVLAHLRSPQEERLRTQPVVVEERLPFQGLGGDEDDQVSTIRCIALQEVGLRGKLAGKDEPLGLLGLLPLLVRELALCLGLLPLLLRKLTLCLGLLLLLLSELALRLRRIALDLGLGPLRLGLGEGTDRLGPRLGGRVALLLGDIARPLRFRHGHLELAERILGAFTLGLGPFSPAYRLR